MKLLKLYHNSTLVGNIVSHSANGFWWHGTIELTSAAEEYQSVFDWWTDENRDKSKEPPFPEEILENWYVESPDKGKQPIGLPGVYKDNKISWRYF